MVFDNRRHEVSQLVQSTAVEYETLGRGYILPGINAVCVEIMHTENPTSAQEQWVPRKI